MLRGGRTHKPDPTRIGLPGRVRWNWKLAVAGMGGCRRDCGCRGGGEKAREGQRRVRICFLI